MSDPTVTPPEAPMPTAPTKNTVTAEVCGASCSYFIKDYVRDATGDPLMVPGTNVPVISTQRLEARMGDIIEVTPYEFARLSAPDVAVLQEPGSRPLANSPNRPRVATPFGVPMRIDDPSDPDHGEIAGFRGPVMGDPRPIGGMTDAQLAKSGGLTPAESLAFHQQANGAQDPERGTDDTLYESYMGNDRDELVSEAAEKGLTVTRSDGRTDLEPRKEDLARALADSERDPDTVEES